LMDAKAPSKSLPGGETLSFEGKSFIDSELSCKIKTNGFWGL